VHALHRHCVQRTCKHTLPSLHECAYSHCGATRLSLACASPFPLSLLQRLLVRSIGVSSRRPSLTHTHTTPSHHNPHTQISSTGPPSFLPLPRPPRPAPPVPFSLLLLHLLWPQRPPTLLTQQQQPTCPPPPLFPPPPPPPSPRPGAAASANPSEGRSRC